MATACDLHDASRWPPEKWSAKQKQTNSLFAGLLWRAVATGRMALLQPVHKIEALSGRPCRNFYRSNGDGSEKDYEIIVFAGHEHCNREQQTFSAPAEWHRHGGIVCVCAHYSCSALA